MSNVGIFKPGDRVRIKATEESGFISQVVRTRVKRGIPATITRIVGTAIRPEHRDYDITFDTVGRLSRLRITVAARDLEALEVSQDVETVVQGRVSDAE